MKSRSLQERKEKERMEKNSRSYSINFRVLESFQPKIKNRKIFRSHKSRMKAATRPKKRKAGDLSDGTEEKVSVKKQKTVRFSLVVILSDFPRLLLPKVEFGF
jgi:hypothetical protein